MNKLICLILATAGLLAACSMVWAQTKQIYTWTDDNGVMHFVDTPTDNPNAESRDVPAANGPRDSNADSPTVVTSADSAENTGGSEEEVVSYAEQRRRRIAERGEERRLARDENKGICARARAEVARLEPSRRVYFTNDQGEIERVDDEERVREVEKAKAVIAKNCQ